MLGKILGGLGRALIVAGLVVLGFVAYQLWGTGLETSRAQDQLTADLADSLLPDGGEGEPEDETEADDVATPDLAEVAEQMAQVDSATAPPMAPPAEGEPVGIIEIPRIGLTSVVVEGVSKADLKKGPGRYPGTAMPGQAGNSAIAGHRTTYGAPFNRIDELDPGDEIRVTTAQGQFVYKVMTAPGEAAQAWYIVSPSQVEVLADFGDNRLTLTACHPKYSARQRIIVNALLTAPPAATPEIVSVERPDNTPTPEVASPVLDEGLEGDSSALAPALLFGGAAALLMLLAWVLAQHWHRWAIYVVAAPGVLVLIWFGYVYMDRYLPAL